MKKVLLVTVGHFFLLLGIIGAFLPVLPTTPFLLLAAYFYSRSDSPLLIWLKEHKVFGPPLKDWQNSGVIGLKAKWLATAMLLLVMVWRIPLLPVVLAIKILAETVLVAVLIFIWTRPSHRP